MELLDQLSNKQKQIFLLDVIWYSEDDVMELNTAELNEWIIEAYAVEEAIEYFS